MENIVIPSPLMTVHLENDGVLLPGELLSRCAGGRLSSRAAHYKILDHKHPLGLNPGFFGFPTPAFLKGEIKYQFGIRHLVSKILFSRIRKCQNKGSLYIFSLFCSVLFHAILLIRIICFFVGLMPPLAHNTWGTGNKSVVSE